jgi:hypothetical protein
MVTEMSDNGRVLPYERRVRLVASVIRGHSDLDAAAARELAVHVVHALDHVPEKMR